MKSTLVLFSSARRHGNTGCLVDRLCRDLTLEPIDLAGLRIAPYSYEHANRADDLEPLMQRVLDHEQIVFASPIYWYSVTPQMKAFLDRICDYLDLPDLVDQGRRLRGKTGFVVCTSGNARPDDAFVEAFRLTFEYLGMTFGGLLHADCLSGYQAEQYESDVAAFATLLRG